jgi:hypothetical protein
MAEVQRKPRLKLIQDTIATYTEKETRYRSERNPCPGVYLNGFNDQECYYFSGGGSVLKALEQGSTFKIKPIERL